MHAEEGSTRTVDYSFAGKLAVVTGGGSGIGRELVLQLAAQGCSVAACDLNAGTVAETVALAGRPAGTLVTGHVCDVSAEEQVLRFRDELLRQHARAHVDLVFSNAGVSGGHSFIGSVIGDSREEWERVFAIRWWGVYHCARVFLPLLMASGDGVLVNTSGMNGFWATFGPGKPGSATSTAEFAVKGFTEALIEELRVAAPQVRVAVVMPGWVGTDLAANAYPFFTLPRAEQMPDAEVTELVRQGEGALLQAGADLRGLPPEDLRRFIAGITSAFRDNAPTSAADAAATILDGVRSGAWRILVGEDANAIDARVRANPEAAYDYEQLFAGLARPPWQ
jgi:NAD(P)-dependent dehydrogenase (short-subunit alcohol dehydrogenase family)